MLPREACERTHTARNIAASAASDNLNPPGANCLRDFFISFRQIQSQEGSSNRTSRNRCTAIAGVWPNPEPGGTN